MHYLVNMQPSGWNQAATCVKPYNFSVLFKESFGCSK